MANTLNNLIPVAFAPPDVFPRESVGFITEVGPVSRVDSVARGQRFLWPAIAPMTAGDTIARPMAIPGAADQTISNKSLTITKERFFPFSWTGEEQYAMDQGPGFLTLEQDQIAQAMRAAVNEIETDVAVAANLGASRAYGTAGT